VNQISAIQSYEAGEASLPLNVVCVLKQGGCYDLEYVRNLANGIRRHLTAPYRFYCLTDVDPWHPQWFESNRIQHLPLRHRWPGWWSKIELFRPFLFTGRVLYLDLDTLVTGSLAKLAAYDGDFAILRDFYFDQGLGSAVMAWRAGDHGMIYERFKANALASARNFHGDQQWIAHCLDRLEVEPDRIQDLFPDLAVSYKPIPGGAHLQEKPKGASLVCFHGKPKPHDVADQVDFVGEHWG